MGERPANQEMIDGFMEGYNLENPEPSGNRSHSYRHGFAMGRRDKNPIWDGKVADQLRAQADLAMNQDERERSL